MTRQLWRRELFAEYVTLFICLFFLDGCVQQSLISEELKQTPTFVTITQENQVTETVNPIIQVTPISTNTETPRPGISPRPPIPTQTPLPTIDIEKQKESILELIKTNGNCKLPCFLGITPGVTSWETTKNIILSTGVKYSDMLMSDGTHHFTGFDTKDLEISMVMEFVEIDGTVEYIGSGLGDLNNNLSPTKIDWTPYQLNSVLSNYGPPSRVLINIGKPRGPSYTTGYELWLIYSDLGLNLYYSGSGLKIEPTFHVCPNSRGSDGIEALSMFIQSSNYKKLPQVVTDMMSSAKDLQDVTNFSIQDFYQTFKQDDTSKCIESPSKNW